MGRGEGHHGWQEAEGRHNDNNEQPGPRKRNKFTCPQPVDQQGSAPAQQFKAAMGGKGRRGGGGGREPTNQQQPAAGGGGGGVKKDSASEEELPEKLKGCDPKLIEMVTRRKKRKKASSSFFLMMVVLTHSIIHPSSCVKCVYPPPPVF
jgi:hypothetical protein